jgi:ParB-like chromosome segregation protein Spo0J
MVEGLKENGFDKAHPIILYEGKILDGVHRYKASKRTKTKPVFKNFTGDDPYAFVVQENLGRRNLTPSQAAMIGAELVERMKEAEKAEKEAAKKNRHRPRKKARAKGSKAGRAAKAMGVSERNVAGASALRKGSPRLAEEVKTGRKSLHKATKELEAEKSKEKEKTDEFVKAVDVIERVISKEFAATARKKLKAKEILEMASLDTAEIKRIAPFIESGWSLKAALGYKSQSLSYGHTLRQLRDRAIAQGGDYTLIMDDGWEFTAHNKELAKLVL